MRLAAPLFAAFAVATGCAHRGAPAVAPPLAAAPSQRATHWARLGQPTDDGAVRFTLARPAYVAVFEVTPGESVRLVYPVTAGQAARRLGATDHTRPARRGVVVPPRLVRFYDGYSPRPRYLYLVASDRPLDLAEPLGWPGGSLPGVRTVGDVRVDPTALNVESTFETLFDLVVTSTAASDVDTDVLEYYPDVRFRRGGQVASLTAFRCANGQLVYVPVAGGSGYLADDWFGVDFIGNRYVGAECFQRHVVNGQGGVGQGGTGVGVGPRSPAGGAARAAPDTLRARDVLPNAPVEPERLSPAGGVPGSGQGTGPMSGFDRAEPIERRPAPPPSARPEPRSVEREPRLEPPRPAPAPRTEPRPAPRAEPRLEPASRPEPRSEPPRLEPARSEPMSDPSRGAVAPRSEPGAVREQLQPAP